MAWAFAWGLVPALMSGLLPALASADDAVAEELAELTVRLNEAPADVTLRLDRAAAWRRAGRYEEALDDLRVAAALAPRSPRHRLETARVRVELGELEAARAELDGLLGDAPPRGLRWAAWALRASVQLALGDARGALDDYRAASAIRLTVDLALGEGRALRRLGALDEAARRYREALPALGGARLVRLALVETLRDAGRPAEALAALEEAPPRGLKARWQLRRAQLLDDLGRPAEARAAREAALAEAHRRAVLRPSAGALLERARARLALGEREAARADALRARALAPTWRPVGAFLARLEARR
ncbi:MAG TPA: hypothetical protein RMH85_23020 [Polyangiaceae bacterium LLY-WYZ-15_(1-7)]|nr:hypothetical protein [Polyangiaceae bacterium LLY-WYZ-15_(1-7)]HJL11366.1 hypothetical protein [Polyangiaceae bacterium LLY-WYZ-15_(1-7)]